MYSDFIEDRLAQNSEYIALLKKGIQDFEPDWLESNFRQKIKYETLKPVDQFFDNLYFNYDDNERLFIYKSTYSQAGFKESLKNLEKFAPGLKVNIQEGSFSYTPYLKFTKSSSYYVSENISGFQYGSNKYVYLSFDGSRGLYYLPYTTSSFPSEPSYAGFAINIPNQSSVPGKCIDVRDRDTGGTRISNYISSVAAPGDTVKITYRLTSTSSTNNKTFTMPSRDSSETQITISSADGWYLVKDTAASEILEYPLWFINYRGSYTSTINDIEIYIAPSSTTLVFSANGNTLTLSGNENELNSCLFALSDTEYICNLNPVVVFSNSLGDPVEFPSQTATNSPPYYNITVSTTAEIFKDYELFKSRFNYLIQELLFYYNCTSTFYITFEVNAVNAEKHHLNINSRIYRFANISGAGLYEPSQN